MPSFLCSRHPGGSEDWGPYGKMGMGGEGRQDFQLAHKAPRALWNPTQASLLAQLTSTK